MNLMVNQDSEAHLLETSKLLALMQVDSRVGLSEQRHQNLLRLHGPNELAAPAPVPFIKLLAKQFQDILVLILLGAMVVSFALALLDAGEDDQLTSFVEPFVILLILVANAAVGVVQETNAEKAIASLKKMEAETARVLREGAVLTVPATDVVPGDIIYVQTGDKVPADIRIIEIKSSTLEVDESCLTGESRAVSKSSGPVKGHHLVDQDKVNMLFSSTLITRGQGIGVVIFTGSDTSIGKIQQGLVSRDDDTKTPLQEQLDQFGELLSKVILGICILVWLINVGHFTDPEHGSFIRGAIYYFKIAVALAVAAIPEGLPAVVTTCLALGTMRMAKKHAIVRTLPSVETLGCTSVICADKTGTLTTNEMSACYVFTASNEGHIAGYDVTGIGWCPRGNVVPEAESPHEIPSVAENVCLKMLSKIAALCNEAHLQFDEISKTYSKTGDSTEAALRVLVEKLHDGGASGNRFNAGSSYWEEQSPREHLLEFDRERKSMGVIVRRDPQSRSSQLLVKGAPESVLSRCSNVIQPNGTVHVLSRNMRDAIFNRLKKLEGDGIRCFALAYLDQVQVPSKDIRDSSKYASIESALTFVGVVGFIDPPREAVPAALARCRQAGIRVIVITGDSLDTAAAICRRIGLFSNDEPIQSVAMTGSQFSALDKISRMTSVSRIQLFARVEPSHKKELVELLKKQKQTVAMTGDGVNDAPALRAADIGIAMGSGTAVAREASDMVLQDDNFATIVTAVEEGRAIYANTKQFIRYLISSNIGEVACIFLTAALGIPEVLVPIQLLWVNLVTDGLPATALSFNKDDGDLMRGRPRSRNVPMVSRWLFMRYMAIGIYVGIATIGGFIWWYSDFSGGPMLSFDQLRRFEKCNNEAKEWESVDCNVFKNRAASTVALSILVTVEMLNALNALSEKQSLLVVPPWSNPWVLVAIMISFLLHFAILYIEWFSKVFGVTSLSLEEWYAVWAFSIPVVILDEIFKLFSRNGHGERCVERLRFLVNRHVRSYARLQRDRSESVDEGISRSDTNSVV